MRRRWFDRKFARYADPPARTGERASLTITFPEGGTTFSGGPRQFGNGRTEAGEKADDSRMIREGMHAAFPPLTYLGNLAGPAFPPQPERNRDYQVAPDGTRVLRDDVRSLMQGFAASRQPGCPYRNVFGASPPGCRCASCYQVPPDAMDGSDCICGPAIGGIPCPSPRCVRLDLPVRRWTGAGYVTGDLTWRQAVDQGYAEEDIGLGRVAMDGEQ
jgi:hypothetical protein